MAFYQVNQCIPTQWLKSFFSLVGSQGSEVESTNIQVHLTTGSYHRCKSIMLLNVQYFGAVLLRFSLA